MRDFEVRNEGSLVLLTPVTDAAREWLEEHVGSDNGYQPMWPTCVIERRYAADVLQGAVNDGLHLTCGPLCPEHGDPRDTNIVPKEESK